MVRSCLRASSERAPVGTLLDLLGASAGIVFHASRIILAGGALCFSLGRYTSPDDTQEWHVNRDCFAGRAFATGPIPQQPDPRDRARRSRSAFRCTWRAVRALRRNRPRRDSAGDRSPKPPRWSLCSGPSVRARLPSSITFERAHIVIVPEMDASWFREIGVEIDAAKGCSAVLLAAGNELRQAERHCRGIHRLGPARYAQKFGFEHVAVITRCEH